MLTTSITKTSAIQKFLLGCAVSVACLMPNVASAQYTSQLQHLQQQKQLYQEQMENLQTDLGFYILTNPKASAAVLASGVGVAATLTEDIDATTQMTLAFVGGVGANYCLTPGNRQHCAQVFANLTNYAIQLNNYQEQIDALTWEINRLQR